MSDDPSTDLTSDQIDTLVRNVVAEGRAGRTLAASQMAQPLIRAQHRQPKAARALLWIVGEACVEREEAVKILSDILQSHDQDADIMSALGEYLETARDIDDLNAPPPADPVFQKAVDKLVALAKAYQGKPEEEQILCALATAARMLARQQDATAESCYRKLLEFNPQKSSYHYDLGLFYKTRGRFAEGMAANQRATGPADETDQAQQWNLAICATGAGNAAVALDVWKRMGQNIEIGRFGLPDGLYPACKVKLAERPLAERTADLDDPGEEETVWIERLSPCHGIIRSVLYAKLGVDFGDVILMDGAPITHHTYGEQRIAVFPHLATLMRRNYQIFDFAGTQETEGQLAELGDELGGEVMIDVHSESLAIMCAACWRDPELDHDQHERIEKQVVRGRIAAPPDMAPVRILELIDRGLDQHDHCQLYVPDLCAAAELKGREQADRHRFTLLTSNLRA